MRRGVLAVVFVLVVVGAVVLLREPPPEPVKPAPQPERATQALIHASAWQEVPLPAGTDQPHRAVADLQRAVFPVRGADGVQRLLSRTAATDIEVARGSGGPEPLGVTLNGTQLVVSEVSASATSVSTVDLSTGVRTGVAAGFPAGTVAVAGGTVAVQESEQCLVFLDATTLRSQSRHCAPAGWAISFLTSEPDGVQWRETRPDVRCATWFRRDKPLTTGERACRAAVLVHVDGWELTADFPPYEVGSLIPGPLIARKGDREILLDTNSLDIHACGRHVYWLSKPGDQAGNLVRWRPGEAKVDLLNIGPGGPSSPRCVNGVLNVVTYGTAPHLWTLANP